MKLLKGIVALMLVFMVSSAFVMKNDKKGVYIAGVSASFNDSLVYFTDILFVDSVELEKYDFLPLRYQYSGQLEDYLLQKHGLKNRTSFIYFNQNKSKLEKEMKKLKEKYRKAGKSLIHQVDTDFKFKKATEF